MFELRKICKIRCICSVRCMFDSGKPCVRSYKRVAVASLAMESNPLLCTGKRGLESHL
jgi:hypothetical protein